MGNSPPEWIIATLGVKRVIEAIGVDRLRDYFIERHVAKKILELIGFQYLSDVQRQRSRELIADD